MSQTSHVTSLRRLFAVSRDCECNLDVATVTRTRLVRGRERGRLRATTAACVAAGLAVARGSWFPAIQKRLPEAVEKFLPFDSRRARRDAAIETRDWSGGHTEKPLQRSLYS